MTDYIRRLVSGPKARFKDSTLGLELDLVYVTDHIIIMGYPATGIEGLYRNRREDAKRFLDHRHGKNYWVFNFCPIRENSYDKNVFEGRVTRFPFPDHHAPPLAILPLAAREISAWLNGSPERVAVLHCKAGKGRSGTMACTYLLTLGTNPTPPQLKRSHDAKEWATIRTDETINILPKEDEIPGDSESRASTATTHITKRQPKPILDKFIHKGDVNSDTTGILEESGGVPPPVSSPLPLQPPPNPEKSFTDSLKGVLDLHTARRMKPVGADAKPSTSATPGSTSSQKGNEKKQKQGVSIPSQRRWLYYWALLLADEAPRDVWSGGGVEVRSLQGRIEKPKVRITQVKLRMRETTGVKLGIVRAANAVLDRAGSVKVSNSKALQSSSSFSSSTSATDKKNPNQIWASVARYDDELVEVLEKWETWTRDSGKANGGGGMGKRKKGSEWMPPDVEGIEHDLSSLFDENGKWDKGKMVRSFARFGIKDPKDETVVVEAGSSDKGKEKIHSYTLRLLSDKRWDDLKQRVGSSTATNVLSFEAGGGSAAADNPNVPSFKLEDTSTTLTFAEVAEDLKKNIESMDVPGSEVNSLYDGSSLGEEVENKNGNGNGDYNGLILDASREVRIKLYMGQVFMGWFWFIPTFHMPQPPSTSDPDSSKTRKTFHLTRKDLDFPLGVGSGIVDVDVDMEWVMPQTSAAALVSSVDASLPVRSSNKTDSIEEAEAAGAIATVVHAVVGAGDGGIRDTVKVRQGNDV